MASRKYKYKVLYRVKGTDHTGYCSGRDGDDDGVEVDHMEVKYVFDGPIAKLKALNHTVDGCTNVNGSQCCKNFRQKYKAVAILSVKEVAKTRPADPSYVEQDA